MSTGALFKGIRSGPKRQKFCYVIKNLYRLHNLKNYKINSNCLIIAEPRNTFKTRFIVHRTMNTLFHWLSQREDY